jgi:hypothetical protein
VDVLMLQQGAVTGRIWASIYETSGGTPINVSLATSDKLNAAGIHTSGGHWIRFPFRSPVTLTAGTTYALVMEGDYTPSATVNIIIRENSAGGYAAGSVFTYDGTTWSAAGADMAFKVYVTRNDTAVAMPGGYDRKRLVGYVFNNSGSDLGGFIAHDRTVALLYTADSGNVTSTAPTLIDFVTALPPVPVIPDFTLRSSVADDQAFGGPVPDIGYLTVGGSLLALPAAAGFEHPATPIHTEYQGIYVARSSGTGNINLRVKRYTW